MRFENKVALVTGAATGHWCGNGAGLCGGGRAGCPLRCKRAGAEGKTARYRDRRRNLPGSCAPMSRNRLEAQRMAEEAVAAYGGIDYLVASAGIQTYGTVVDTDEDTWDRTLDINAKGVYLAAKYLCSGDGQRGAAAR